MRFLEYHRLKRLKEFRVPLLESFIRSGASVLDFGSGNGLLAEVLAQKTGAHFTLIDTVDYNVSKLPLRLFDGERIPYPDNTFDQSLTVFVLHHVADPQQQEALIDELARVTKGDIIVWEDTPQYWFEYVINSWWDFFINFVTSREVHVPHSYRTAENWKELFSRHNLLVSKEIPVRDFVWFFGGYTQRIFILRKK